MTPESSVRSNLPEPSRGLAVVLVHGIGEWCSTLRSESGLELLFGFLCKGLMWFSFGLGCVVQLAEVRVTIRIVEIVRVRVI